MLKCPKMNKRHRGFTLVELLVTITVLGLLVSVGLPSVRDFVVSNRLSSDINSFVGLVNYARSEAITRNQSVIICPKTAGSNTCQADNKWNLYDVQVFVDVDGSGDFSAGDILLKTLPAVDSTGSQTKFWRTAAGVVSFGTVGFARQASTFNVETVSSDTAYVTKYGRTLCLSQPGRVTTLAYNATCP
jgi:type IV fimbrial biogenesis protein FimT